MFSSPLGAFTYCSAELVTVYQTLYPHVVVAAGWEGGSPAIPSLILPHQMVQNFVRTAVLLSLTLLPTSASRLLRQQRHTQGKRDRENVASYGFRPDRHSLFAVDHHNSH